MNPLTPAPVIPVLITWDVDPDTWLSLEKRYKALHTAIDLCNSLSIPATFYVTAQPAQVYEAEFKQMKTQGHEIGCHGLTHGNEEDYNRMPQAQQRDYIQQATLTLQTLTGQPITAFRSPRVKTSAVTLRLLAEQGYHTDSSVCSQRVDLISSNLINPGWLTAPRRAYHPHSDNPFKRGQLPLWEIPVAAAVLPFISSALRVFGLPLMKGLFKLLYSESRYTGKPIVYLAHPTEFLNRRQFQAEGQGKRYTKYLKPEYFSPAFIRTHGLRLRNILYHVEGEALLNCTRDLFSYMAGYPGVKFMTMSQYAVWLNGGNVDV